MIHLNVRIYYNFKLRHCFQTTPVKIYKLLKNEGGISVLSMVTSTQGLL